MAGKYKVRKETYRILFECASIVYPDMPRGLRKKVTEEVVRHYSLYYATASDMHMAAQDWTRWLRILGVDALVTTRFQSAARAVEHEFILKGIPFDYDLHKGEA